MYITSSVYLLLLMGVICKVLFFVEYKYISLFLLSFIALFKCKKVFIVDSNYFSSPLRPSLSKNTARFSGNGRNLPDLNTFITEQARKRYTSPVRQAGESNHDYQVRRLDRWDTLCTEERTKIENRQKQQHLEVPSSQQPKNKNASSSIWGWLSPRSGSPSPKPKK